MINFLKKKNSREVGIKKAVKHWLGGGYLVFVAWRSLMQGCQFRFGRCFVFSIEMECFSFGVFRRAVSGLYCSYIYIQQT